MTNRTQTSSFGVVKRESHDSTQFYGRRLYRGHSVSVQERVAETNVPDSVLDTVSCQNSRSMQNIPANCIHLMVTSPPYNVGKEYDEDLDLNEYLSLLHDVLSETYRVLVEGGRACINIANVGRKPYIAYHKHVIDLMAELGFLMRGEVIWNKGAGAGGSTAWGSWCSPKNPTLRDVHEYILIFSKGRFDRDSSTGRSTIEKSEFLEFTKSIWTFSPASARREGHPAPFPFELPYRLIQLYTYEGDVVLDPFCGIGTTCVAALRTGRHYVGFDCEERFVRIARERMRNAAAVQTQLSEFREPEGGT